MSGRAASGPPRGSRARAPGGPRRVDQGEAAASEPEADRLDHAQGKGGGTAASTASLLAATWKRRLGREWMSGSDGAARGDRGKREQQREHEHGGAL